MYAVVVVVDGYMCVTTQRTFVVAAVTVVNAVGSIHVTTPSTRVLLLMAAADGLTCVITQRAFVVAAVTVVNAVGSIRVTTQSA